MKVSVIIPVYNAEPYLAEAVRSALIQPQTGEIILIEDGSRDNSLDVCLRLEREFESVSVYRHRSGKNRGAAASRNLGIQHAKMAFISFLDADDFYLPGRFSQAEKLFSEHPGIDGVYGAVDVFFETEFAQDVWRNNPIHRGNTLTAVTTSVPPQRLLNALIMGYQGAFHTDSITLKRTLFDRTGLFDETLILHQDTAMWLKMAAVGTLVSGDTRIPVATRRIHDQNRINQVPKGFNTYMKVLDDVLVLWGEQRGLPRESMQLLYFQQWRNQFYTYNLWMRAEIEGAEGSVFAQVSRRIAFTFKRFLESPRLILSGHFLRFLTAAVIARLGNSG
jgi:glycosyltransferase involved in cell wall biosynthesis